MTGERKIYRNDPIQEALCEIRFVKPDKGWALLPGQLFERLKDEYPSEPTQDENFGGFGPLGAGNNAPFQVRIAQGIPG